MKTPPPNRKSKSNLSPELKRTNKPKTMFIIFSVEQAKKLAQQIDTIRKEHPNLFKGPLEDLINLVK